VRRSAHSGRKRGFRLEALPTQVRLWIVRAGFRRTLFGLLAIALFGATVANRCAGGTVVVGRTGWYAALGGLVFLLLLSKLGTRRFSLPFEGLVYAADKLRRGDLSARVTLHRGSRREFRVLADAFNGMASRLQLDIEAQRQSLALASHELKTPLARLGFLLEELREDGADSVRVSRAEAEIVQMSELLTDLLARSRLDMQALQLGDILGADLAIGAVESARADVALLEVVATAARVRCDVTLCRRALVNLLDNARIHGGGLRQVRVRTAGSNVEFEVCDYGPGLPEALAAGHATTATPSASQPQSSGLGIVLARKVAEAHAGTLRYSHDETGGVAHFALPLWVP
jgi:two-component system, OmpR family, sensor kinase